MVADRVLTEVMASLSATVLGDATPEVVLQQLAQGAVRALALDGAGVMVPDDEELLRFAFAAGPDAEAVALVERLQEELAAGPCQVSHQEQRTLDLADLAVEGSWPTYQDAAVRCGLHAVAALPLLARGRSWGVLALYRRAPHRLDPSRLAAAQTLAQLATSYLVVTADRDEAREAQDRLAHRAMHDPLTGLPVRWAFLEQLTHALARLGRHPGHVGVLFADLDGLKQVNDRDGHAAGDRLLLRCAERIRAAVRPSDVVARLGGDEFVVLLEDLASADAGDAVARRIQAELALPVGPGGQDPRPSASLGLAVTSDPGTAPEALVARADTAMYRAKRSGRGRYERYGPPPPPRREQRTACRPRDGGLRAALRSGELTVHYQPVLELTGRAGPGSDGSGADRAVTDPRRLASTVYAVEALVRWQHPDRGLLSGCDVVPEAEDDGLLPELDAWVLSTACRQLAQWDEALGSRSPSRLFVNVSPDGGTDHSGQLAGALRDSGVAPQRLTVEVSETALLGDSPTSARVLAALHELGCQVAVDDLGTGSSSLCRLVEVPASTWKIDGSFVREVADRPAAATLVSAVVGLGRTLQRTVVAEGVEDEATLRTLQDLGCTHAQGRHLAAPQPAAQISALLGTA